MSAPSTPGPAHPLRATAPAFGGTLAIEIRDLPAEAATAAIQAAVDEVGAIERLTDPDSPTGDLAALNAAAGKGARRIDPRLFAALARALEFCEWSDGKQGPLGRDLHRLWRQGGAGAPPDAPPPPALLDQAVAAASCKHLKLDAGKQTAKLDAGKQTAKPDAGKQTAKPDAGKQTATLDAGKPTATLDAGKPTAALDACSALDLVDFATGFAVDRAIILLRQHGSANAFVQLHALHRGIGPGRDGRGWAIDLPAFGGLREPLGRIYLRDQALAVATRDDHPPGLDGSRPAPFVDQSNGQPAGEDIFAVLAVTDLATDAQALAATMFVTGAVAGELLTGSIRPRPSILWLEGTGTGAPLLVDYRWTDVPKR